jgi:inosine-uridine nucleoside N-ribohydrolase
MKKIIIDTDPGVDDSIAILFAIASKQNIIGLTTTYGNSNITNTTQNALTILDILESNIPVYQGSAQPIVKQAILAKSHGKNGLGEFSLKNLKRKKENISAIQFYINTLEKNKDKSINILCLGPTTNLALLNIIRPDLVSKINQVIILGGVFFENGNITPNAEFNVYSDPEALNIILNINVSKTLIPINVCRKVMFDLNDFNRINNTKLSNNFKQITKNFIDYYKNDKNYGNFKGGVMYDLLVTCYYKNPKIFKNQNKFITVNSQGQTKIKNNSISNCNLVTDVNPKKIKQLFFNTINTKYEK